MSISILWIRAGVGDYHYTIDRADNGKRPGDLDLLARAAKVLGPPAVVRPISYRPAAGAAPQEGNSSTREAALSGKVTDQLGAPVRGAALTAVNTDKGAFMRRVSGDSGAYSFFFLPPGNYNIEIAADGFLRLLQENVRVEAGKSVGLNFKLTAGGAGRTPPFVAQPGMVEWLIPESGMVWMPPGVVGKPVAGPQGGGGVPDEALLQNGLLAIEQGRYEAGRMTLQTLVNIVSRLAVCSAGEGGDCG